MSAFHRTNAARLLCVTTLPLFAFSCAPFSAQDPPFGGVPCSVQNRVRERQERFSVANWCRRLWNDWPLVETSLLVLSLVVGAGGFAPLAPVLVDSMAFAHIFLGRNKRKLCCLQNADTHRR
jgi:hypothetical protein